MTEWECAVCGANMGGMYDHLYPGDSEVTTLCEDCIEAAEEATSTS